MCRLSWGHSSPLLLLTAPASLHNYNRTTDSGLAGGAQSQEGDGNIFFYGGTDSKYLCGPYSLLSDTADNK